MDNACIMRLHVRACVRVFTRACPQAAQRIQTLEKLLSTARDEAVTAKIYAQRETTSAQQQLKDAEYALKDAKDEAGHVQHMHQLAVYEAADVRRQLDSTRQELQQARAQLRGNQEKVRDLESSLSAMDVTIEKQTEHMRREHAVELEQIERQLLSLQESNRDAENAYREVKRLEQALAALDGDNTALRERLKEDARARAEDESMAARALEEIQHERLASHAKVSKGEEALREEASRRRELEEEVARLRRELEALRPVAQSYSALQEQMRNVEDDSSRLRQELDAGKHLSSVFTGVCFTLTCVTDGHVDSLI